MNVIDIICYVFSMIFIILAIYFFSKPIFKYKKQKVRDNEAIYRILAILCLFLSMLLAQTFAKYDGGVFGYKVYVAILQFVLNTDYNTVINAIPDLFGKILAGANLFLAPILTIATILAAFESLRNTLKIFRYNLSHKLNIYVFSELNDKSLAIATSLKDDKNARFIFADVFEQNNECSYELVNQVKDLGGAYTKIDVMSMKWYKCQLKKRMTKFFLISENEVENLNHLSKLINDYNKEEFKEKIEFYLFSNSSISELAIENQLRDNIYVMPKRIDYKRSMVYDYLINKGSKILDKADGGDFDIVLLGFGEYGLEMLKALLWFCQGNGQIGRFTVFDKNANIENVFKLACPGFFDTKTLEALDKQFDIKFNPSFENGVDFNDHDALKEICKNKKNATLFFVSTGSDESNIFVSRKIREFMYQDLIVTNNSFFEKMELDETVEEIQKELDKFKKIEKKTARQEVREKELKTNKGQIINQNDDLIYENVVGRFPLLVTVAQKTIIDNNTYNIDFIGGFNRIYSYDICCASNLEKTAKKVHEESMDKGNTSYNTSFYKEYNYRSSVSQVLYHKLWSKDKFKNSTKLTKNDYEKYSDVHRNEKNRWNTYELTEGYIFYDEKAVADKAINCSSLKNNLKKNYHLHNEIMKFDDERLEKEWEWTFEALNNIFDLRS